MKRVLVVAHPDDEVMWFGGLLIAEPGDWTVICCSIPRRDPERAWKFFDACEALGARGRLIPFTETEATVADPSRLDLLDLSGFDQIVTHNANGEYGHDHHKAVHRWIVSRWPGKVLVSGYGAACATAKVIALSNEQYERKLATMRCYNHVAPLDNGKPKWKALLDRYAGQFDLSVETYARA